MAERHKTMLEQLLQMPPTPGGAAEYGKALHEIARAVAEERLELDREKQTVATQVREIESQRAILRELPDNLRTILTGVQSLRESLGTPQEATLFADVTAIKQSISEVHVLAEGLVAKSDETQQRIEGAQALSDSLNGRVDNVVGRLDALARQCAQMKISATSLQIDCRNAVVASVDATRDAAREEVGKLAGLQAATGHINQVVNALGQKLYGICEGELAVIYRSVSETSKAVTESRKGFKTLQATLTSDVAKSKDEYKAKYDECKTKHDDYKAKYEAECRRTAALEKELQEIRDGAQMPSDASKTLDHLCVLVDQTLEEVLSQKNPRAVDRDTITELRKDIAVAHGRMVTQEDAKQVLLTLAQEAKVAGLERQELVSLRAKAAELETALQDAKVTLGEEESRKARWDNEMKRLAEDKHLLKKEAKRLKAKLRAQGGDVAPEDEEMD
jgi:uncharacterized phage infection (PIP) family protein YhgE